LLLPSVTLVSMACLKFKSLIPTFTTHKLARDNLVTFEKDSISDHPENLQTLKEIHGDAGHQEDVSTDCPWSFRSMATFKIAF